MRSLQARLGSGLIISLVVVFTVLWFVVSASIQTLAEEYIASRLEHDAESLLSQIEPAQHAVPNLVQDSAGSVYNRPFSGHYFQITIDKRIIKSRSLWDRLLKTHLVSVGEQQRSYQDGPDGQSLLVMHTAFFKQGKAIHISVAEDLNPVKANINQFKRRFAITALAMLMVLVVLQVVILRRSLGSLRQIRDELRQLQAGEIAQLSHSELDELRPMVEEINHLITSMSKRLHRSRDSLGDLTHAIKRPLTVIQQYVEQADTLPAQIRSDMLEQLSMINQLAERILKRASLAGDQHGISSFNFIDDLDSLVRALRQMYRSRELDIEIKRQSDIAFRIDRHDMMELLGNLLDNACKWASSKVRIEIAYDTELVVSIEDDGPGIDEASLEQLAQRGHRLDESKPGYGLGLSIVADIVEEYSGTIHYSHSNQLGGFMVLVKLPESFRV